MSWLLLALSFTVLGMMAAMCCCDTCTIFEDDFSTDRTGTDYTTVSGTFTVGSGVLTTSSSSAVILSDTPVPGGLNGVFHSGSLKFGNNADQGKIIFAATDSSNFWYFQVQPGATDGTAKLYQRSSGVDTQQGLTVTVTGLNTGETIPYTVCYDGQKVVLTMSTVACMVHTASITVAGTFSGFGTGSVTTLVTFDDLLISKHVVDDASCPYCDIMTTACGTCGGCATGTVVERVQIDLPAPVPFGVPACSAPVCSSIAGSYILDLVTTGVGGNQCGWDYYFPSAICGFDRLTLRTFGGGVLKDIEIRLQDATATKLLIWNDDDADPPDCSSWSSRSVPVAGGALVAGCYHNTSTNPPALISNV